MGFWGWFFLMLVFGLLFLRPRLRAWLQGMTAGQLSSLLGGAVTGLLITMTVIAVSNFVMYDAGYGGESGGLLWPAHLIAALCAWGLLLGLFESGRRKTASVQEQAQRTLRITSEVQRRSAADTQQSAGTPRAKAPVARKLPPLRTPARPDPGAAAGTAGSSLGEQLFGEQWRKLVDQTGLKQTEERKLIQLLAEGERDTQARELAEQQLTAAEAKLDLAFRDDAPWAGTKVAAEPETPAEPEVAVQPQFVPLQSGGRTATLHTPEPDTPHAVTLSPQAYRGQAAPPASISAAQARLNARPAGPVSIGPISGLRPPGPVVLGGSSLQRSVGPVKLQRNPDLAASQLIGSGLSGRLGVQADDAAGGVRFSYQPQGITSRLTGKPAAAPPPPPKPPAKSKQNQPA